MENKTILLISPEPWGTNFVSKHHYANYLAKSNIVYFLNPVKRSKKNPFRMINCLKTKLSSTLFLLDYENLLPRLNHLPKLVQEKVYKRQAHQIIASIDEPIDLVWSFDPNRFFDQSVWNCLTTLYHTVDFHPNSKYEKDIILSSNHFFGVTNRILEEHKQYRNGITISHAADIEGFENHTSPNIPGTKDIRACYVGNLHKHIDYKVLLKMVIENPDVDFIIIGPIENSNLSSGNKIDQDTLNLLKSNSNIHFIGSVPPSKLMSYIKACQINLVLFKKEHEKTHCSPHKLMGYFFSENVTLSNYIDAHKNTDAAIITMVNNQAGIPEEFTKIKSRLDFYNKDQFRKKRKDFALKNSYYHKIELIGQITALND